MSDEESVVELYDESTQLRQRNQTATSLRVIHLEDFEAPFTLPTEDREAYLRRFATLFVGESRMREGSTGKISRLSMRLVSVSLLKSMKIYQPREWIMNMGRIVSFRESRAIPRSMAKRT